MAIHDSLTEIQCKIGSIIYIHKETSHDFIPKPSVHELGFFAEGTAWNIHYVMRLTKSQNVNSIMCNYGEQAPT